MRHRTRIYLVLLLITIPILSACTEEMRAQFGNMFEIRDKLVKEYKHEQININLNNGTYLSVTFINSAFNDMKEEERKAGAREIARTTVSSLEKDARISRIAVAFTNHQKKYLIVDYTSSFGSYVFDVPALRKSLPGKPTKKPVAPNT